MSSGTERAPGAPASLDGPVEQKKKTELRIMLKRKVLCELILDPDFNQALNFNAFGSPITLTQSAAGNSMVAQPTKTQIDLA